MVEAIDEKKRDGQITFNFFLRDPKSKERARVEFPFSDNNKPLVPEMIKKVVKETGADEVTIVSDSFRRNLENHEVEAEAIIIRSETKDGAVSLLREYRRLEDGTFEFDDELWDEENQNIGSFTGFFN